MPHKRTAPAVALAFVVLFSGCLGGATTFTAEPATIPASAYESHGYVHGNSTLVPLGQRVGVGPVSRTVGVEVWVSGYSKTTADEDVTGLAVISSPNVRVAGQSVNPLASLGNRELVGAGLDILSDVQALGNVSEVNGLREVDSRPVTMLGEETELVTYAGTVVVEPGETTVDGESVTHEGGSVDVRIHLATVEHEGDVIVVIAVHGADVDETDAVEALASAVEHPGTVERTGEFGESNAVQ
ncbi:hypothetical protein KU306_09055 [Haloferax larsenii]|uniref:Uncharacterized protein n=1 Tax=Haloferax larsenii TaxID=302484 RepID=A0ABY5RDH9_HALLR|nr:DUF6517 family protein [Haloferax larsenii]ELZ84164.1 hypothetical protein C455_00627 [Haloferax larsenii JCM 13917]UVE49083.1 hypothetical protein KU306_09055 [Haloferax larsenii]